jgi:kynureninase
MNIEEARALDRADPLAPLRARFSLPEGVIYLDGNSLGAMPAAVAARVASVVSEEWGRGLITSWNVHDWIDLPGRAGDKVARLVGAEPGSVVVADSTSINIFKALGAALAMRPERPVILTESGNFPTDTYIARAIADFAGGRRVVEVEAENLAGAMTDDVAVVLLTEVNYRTGARLDMAERTAKAHAAGALIIWDLCHSAGAFPVELAAAGADFAVGCGYKYLNGGPGAPAFVYVAPRHQADARQPLQGWLGHAKPFSFAPEYAPAEGANRFRAGTPSVIAMSALDTALDAFEGVDLTAVRRKADALFELFTGVLAARCPELEILTPRDAARRGTQVSVRHPEAYAVMQALIARKVIGDFREPDILRFGLTPLYLSFEDVYRAAEVLCDIITTGSWDTAAFRQRAKVV